MAWQSTTVASGSPINLHNRAASPHAAIDQTASIFMKDGASSRLQWRIATLLCCSEQDIPEKALYRHYLCERLILRLDDDGRVHVTDDGDAAGVAYALRALVYAVEEESGDAHAIAYCRARSFRHDIGIVHDETTAPDYELLDVDACWLMHNDASVARIAPDEVLRFDPSWKLPVLLCYERVEWAARATLSGRVTDAIVRLRMNYWTVYGLQSCRRASR